MRTIHLAAILMAVLALSVANAAAQTSPVSLNVAKEAAPAATMHKGLAAIAR